MAEDAPPVRWANRQAVVTLPERIDRSNAGQVRETLLSVIGRDPAELIVDLTATVSCDHAGVDAVAAAYQRAAGNGTQLRLVVRAAAVRRMLSMNGLDRLVPTYPSLAAATAAAAHVTIVPVAPEPAGPDGQRTARPSAGAPRAEQHPASRPGRRTPATVTRALLLSLIDALTDGVALADGDGLLVLASQRLAAMFGYEPGELAGQPVETLIPADLRAAHRGHRAAYARAPVARPMATGGRLVGLRKDGATFPVEVSLSPVPTATGHLTLAAVHEATEQPQRQDLAALARTAAASRAHHGLELIDAAVHGLFRVGLSLQEAVDLPHDVAVQHIAEALHHLDEAIRQIRDHTFTSHPPPPRRPPPPNGAR